MLSNKNNSPLTGCDNLFNGQPCILSHEPEAGEDNTATKHASQVVDQRYH